MKTTKTKTTTRIAKRAPLPPAPKGLSLLLSMIDECPESACIYARAQQIVADRDDFAKGHNDAIRGAESLEAVFPGLRSERDVEADGSSIKAGVILGAAVAWVLLTDLQGGAR